MADPSSAVASMNAFIASWFTPASLFLLLNLVIATIYLTSRFGSQRRTQQHGPDASPPQLARAPSLLDRVKSIDFGFYKFGPTNPEQEFHNQYPPVESEYAHSYTNSEISAPLARAPSLLERVRSINFQSLCRSDSSSYEKGHNWHVETEYEHPYPNPVARAPSLLGRLKSINFQSLYRSDSMGHEEESHKPLESELYRNADTLAPLARAPSLLDRLKSINFQSLYRSDSNSSEKEHHPQMENKESSYNDDQCHDHIDSHMRRKSESGIKTVARSPAKIKKSISEKTAADTSSENRFVRETERSWSSTAMAENRGRYENSEAEDCVNAKADDFIKRFKQQLKLQRLDSLLGFRNANPN